MIVEHLELRMVPKPSRITARHAHNMRNAHDLRREMAGDAVGLEIVRIQDVESGACMNAGRRAGELGHEWARHRDIGLRSIDRVGPVYGDRAGAVGSFAKDPILGPHIQTEWRDGFLGVGDDMHLMAEPSKAVGMPVGPHADAALDWRIFSDDADLH